jgi:hypothetical protein
LLTGVIVGTYSSIFISAPIVYDTMKRKEKKTMIEKKKNREYLGSKKKEVSDGDVAE